MKMADDRSIRAILVRIETDLGFVREWREIDDAKLDAQGVTGYGGAGKRWQFFILGDEERCMGTAVRLPASGPSVEAATFVGGPHLVKLTDELARRAWTAARKGV